MVILPNSRALIEQKYFIRCYTGHS